MIKRRLSSPRWRLIAAAMLLFVVSGTLAAAFHPLITAAKADDDDDEAESTVSAPSRVTVKNGVTMLTLDAVAQKSGGIETAPPTPPPAQESVTAYGAVLDAAPLTDLHNRYLGAKAQVQTAEAKLTVSRAAFERAKTLYKDRQNISMAQLQSAEGAFQVDQAALAAAQSRLATVAASAQQAWGAALGKAITSGAPLVERLIDRQDYLVKVTLPPDVAIAAPPETTSATLADGETARLQYISPATSTDPRVQGVSYFYDAPAGNGVLPGLSVVVPLPAKAITAGLVVPQAAVVWLHGKAWVYLRTSADTFVRREVALAQGAPNNGYVVEGLAPNAQVTVRGAQMLLSEEFRAQTGSGGDND